LNLFSRFFPGVTAMSISIIRVLFRHGLFNPKLQGVILYLCKLASSSGTSQTFSFSPPLICWRFQPRLPTGVSSYASFIRIIIEVYLYLFSFYFALPSVFLSLLQPFPVLPGLVPFPWAHPICFGTFRPPLFSPLSDNVGFHLDFSFLPDVVSISRLRPLEPYLHVLSCSPDPSSTSPSRSSHLPPLLLNHGCASFFSLLLAFYFTSPAAIQTPVCLLFCCYDVLSFVSSTPKHPLGHPVLPFSSTHAVSSPTRHPTFRGATTP